MFRSFARTALAVAAWVAETGAQAPSVGTAAINPGVLASAGSTHLGADTTSADNLQAVSSLAPCNNFGMLLNRTSNDPNGSGGATPYLDDGRNANNGNVYVTTDKFFSLDGGATAIASFSTHAMMALGLAGLGLARRRAAQRQG